MTDQPVLEVVLFRIKDGITDAAFLKESTVAELWLEQQPGFISREVLKNQDNQWLDTIRWASLELAKQSVPAMLNAETCKAFLSMMDETSVQMWHFEPQALAKS